MEFKLPNGKTKNLKKRSKYLIDWEQESKSKIQRAVKDFLRPYWLCDEVYEEFPVVGTRLSLDFYNHSKGIAIEVQGRQHREYVPYFHGKSRMAFLEQLKRDNLKLDFCEANGIILIEINSEKEINLEFFMENEVI